MVFDRLPDHHVDLFLSVGPARALDFGGFARVVVDVHHGARALSLDAELARGRARERQDALRPRLAHQAGAAREAEEGGPAHHAAAREWEDIAARIEGRALRGQFAHAAAAADRRRAAGDHLPELLEERVEDLPLDREPRELA